MDFTVDCEALRSATAAAIRVVPTRSTVPGTQTFMIEVAGGYLDLTASDAESAGVVYSVMVDERQPGKTLVPADIFNRLVAALPDGPVTVQMADGADFAVLSSDVHEVHVVTMDTDMFPADTVECTPVFAVSASVLCTAIGKVGYAIGTTQSARSLEGIHLNVSAGRLRLTACDGVRLATIEVPGPVDVEREMLLPGRVLRRLAPILSEGRGDVTIAMTEDATTACFDIGHARIRIRGIMENFPNVLAMMPTERSVVVEMPVSTLRSAVRVARTVAKQETGRVQATAQPLDGEDGRGTFAAVSQTSDHGRSASTVPVDMVGDALDVVLNGDFVNEILATMPADGMVAIESNGGTSPCKFSERTDDGAVHLVMPIIKTD